MTPQEFFLKFNIDGCRTKLKMFERRIELKSKQKAEETDSKPPWSKDQWDNNCK